MRRKIKNRHKVKPDYKYQSVVVEQLVNYIMERGKKNVARAIVYGALDDIKNESKHENPAELLELALRNAGPVAEVRSRRIGGATYQVPREVRPARKLALAMRWIIGAAKAKKGKPMRSKLYEEIVAASKNEGEAIKKRETMMKMAEANRAFAHFAW